MDFRIQEWRSRIRGRRGAIGSGYFPSLFEELHRGIRRYRPVSLTSILFPSGSSRNPTRVSSLTVSSFFDSSTQNIHPPTLPAVLSSKWASSSPIYNEPSPFSSHRGVIRSAAISLHSPCFNKYCAKARLMRACASDTAAVAALMRASSCRS